MTAERLNQIQELYLSARQYDPATRPGFLAQACGADEELRREVESLLAQDSGEVMDRPAMALAAELLAGGRLEPGSLVGSYRIEGLLGAGGMGEVYRARDTKLKRDVALKVLPEAFAKDRGRMLRFQREAEVLASLNHPNIAHIYGVEERALVMELVEGKSPKGPLPFEDAWKIALQIADALEYAHEKGVIHRDLKPANVKVTPDGVVKLLDFGLAKAFSETPDTASVDPENSPTVTFGATAAGTVLGTAAYMAPEQAKGKKVDKRADIWSWGVVLYELLTGERLFKGSDSADTLAQVLTKEPDLDRVPPQVRRLLRRCLEKDPKRRLRDVGDAIALVDQVSIAQPRARTTWVPWTIAALALASLVALGVIHFRESPAAFDAVEFSIEAPPETNFVNYYGGYAPSPDGRFLAFSAAAKKGGASLLWFRPLDSLAARSLLGTEGGNFPTWSPDSKSLAFYADGKLKRIEISGSSPLTLSDAAGDDSVSPTGTWSRDGVILFGSAAGLKRVSASPGGSTTLLTKVDPARRETGHGYPQFLPNGDGFLYFIASEDPGVQGIYKSSLHDPAERHLILRTDSKAVYVPPRASYPGYLLWLQDQTLLAQRFEAGSLRLEGDPVSVAEGIGRLTPVPIRAPFWASDAGTLIYLANALFSRSLIWMNRDGSRLGEAAPADNIIGFALAPSANRVAVTRAWSSSGGQGNFDIWVRELDRGGVMTRLTSGPDNRGAVWSPDGKWIAFSSNRQGEVFQIYRKDAFGAGREESLTDGPLNKVALDWSHDDRYILYGERASGRTRANLMALPLQGDRKPILVVEGISPNGSASFSPDGRWVAYGSEFSGSLEIYVEPFPAAFRNSTAPQGRTHISITGGRMPKWRGDGRELYYLGPNGALMAAAIQALPSGLRAETPHELFKPGPIGLYDATPAGRRFMLMPTIDERIQKLNVVYHWQAALRQ
jgi:Tol biopolymer transport system component